MNCLLQAMIITVSIAMACVAYSALYMIEWAKKDICIRREEADRRKPKPQA